MARIEFLTVTVHTEQDVDPSAVADVLIEAGYLVDSVNVTDGRNNRTWTVEE